jgi:nickel/cobalt transporter (NiCoT) family protein
VAVALIIGTIELVSVVTGELGITTGPLAAIGGLDLDYVGFVIVGVFLVTWVVALLVWRYGRIEEKWDAAAAPSGDSS